PLGVPAGASRTGEGRGRMVTEAARRHKLQKSLNLSHMLNSPTGKRATRGRCRWRRIWPEVGRERGAGRVRAVRRGAGASAAADSVAAYWRPRACRGPSPDRAGADLAQVGADQAAR